MTPEYEARRAMALTLGFDVIAASLSMGVAVVMRWAATEGAPLNSFVNGAVAAVVFGMAALFSFYSLGVHRQVWRHSGWPDAVRIMQAVALTALIFLPVLFIWNRLVGFPRSSFLIAVGLWVAILFAGRMAALTLSTRRPLQIFASVRKDAPLAILISHEHQAAELLRELQSIKGGAPVRLLGLLEADGAGPGRAIRGVPILGGLDGLGKVLDLLTVRYGKTPWVAVSGDVRERDTMSAVLEVAASSGAEVMALGLGSEGLHLQPVRPTDLLARPVRRLDPGPVNGFVGGRRVLVTGAGGTIGSQITLHCAEHGAAHLTLYDASEFNLYSIDLMMRERFPDVPVHAQIGNVRDEVRLGQLLRRNQPEIFVHAAALKHVPLMELNACEAILTNVGGVVKAVDAAIAAGMKRFVFISTDKAVDPDNVMGATKRLAELVLAYKVRGTNLAAAMVRFGNVLGSSGSVVPLFEHQISLGGPITLTDNEVSRYFMTVEEASSLVLQAAANNGEPGEASLFVLDMGEPIRIRALAEAMIRMKGMVPDQDIEIRTTGLRPGEKLHEELTYKDERLLDTGIEGLHKITPQTRLAEPEGFRERVDALLEAATHLDTAAALQILSELVPEYTPPAVD